MNVFTVKTGKYSARKFTVNQENKRIKKTNIQNTKSLAGLFTVSN